MPQRVYPKKQASKKKPVKLSISKASSEDSNEAPPPKSSAAKRIAYMRKSRGY